MSFCEIILSRLIQSLLWASPQQLCSTMASRKRASDCTIKHLKVEQCICPKSVSCKHKIHKCARGRQRYKMYLIGIDTATEAVFVVPKSWKINSDPYFWPPKICKNVSKMVREGVRPGPLWDIHDCRWTSWEAGKKYMRNM